jgi:D-alanyl-D-alanine carboxypeptidase
VALPALAPYGDTAEVNDVSAEICNPKAAKVRSETRDDAGRTIQHSPYIHEMERPPVYTLLTLLSGGEAPPPPPKGAKKAAIAATALNVPIPQPRPTF